jgi:hypothetical protein
MLEFDAGGGEYRNGQRAIPEPAIWDALVIAGLAYALVRK